MDAAGRAADAGGANALSNPATISSCKVSSCTAKLRSELGWDTLVRLQVKTQMKIQVKIISIW
jgi:hypothetical protein